MWFWWFMLICNLIIPILFVAAGWMMWKLGWIVLIPTIIVQIPFYGNNINIIGIVGGIIVFIQCLILVFSIVPTERTLKKHFLNAA